jgi:hypothetical protein
MGPIVVNAITTLIAFVSLPAAVIVAGVELLKAGVAWASGESAKKAEAAKHAVYAILGALLLFNAPQIWTQVRAAFGF